MRGAGHRVLKVVHEKTGKEAIFHQNPHDISPNRLTALGTAIEIRRKLNGALPPILIPEFIPTGSETEPEGWWGATFIDGKSLSDIHALHRITRRYQDPAELLHQTAREVQDTLLIMQNPEWTEQGLIHRNIKSGKVIRRPSGEFALIGLENLTTNNREEEDCHTIRDPLGTPAFIAPEAVRSKKPRWTPASDDFGVGMMVMEGVGWLGKIETGEPETTIRERLDGTYREKLEATLKSFTAQGPAMEHKIARNTAARHETRTPWNPDLWETLKTITWLFTHPDPAERLPRADALKLLAPFSL